MIGLRSVWRMASGAGGDTSSRASNVLPPDVLTMISAFEPAVPLLRAHYLSEPNRDFDLVLKGGQMGADDLFTQIRNGTGAA